MKQKLTPKNSFQAFFTKHKGTKIDIKTQGMKNRIGRVRESFSDFVLIEFEHISSFCPGGEFYVCYHYIVDFTLLPK